jgi:hypothetical protein
LVLRGLSSSERGSCTIRCMTHETVPFDTPDSAAEAEADARADADVRDGRLISHDAVRRWLSSLGSAAPLPRPRVGE